MSAKKVFDLQRLLHQICEANLDIDFSIASDIENGRDIYIPFMLIQPFVENAIWHGLVPKDGPKQIEIITQRLELITRSTVTDYFFTITDKEDDESSSLGAKVEVFIPILR